ncbi:single-strand DNA-binding protein [Bacillus oleivorans]|uniref:Single-stranded DNA-binding protein n=1 Tax=Bacillus oleivorans TaxID=1448271 RepID=A0A285D821_9BACI|nr:single-stranded DNA-binding protein [Bacillus oleivorans]SNX75957.1 single-strand DNA-binding protein [Bacillus oleivorans]
MNVIILTGNAVKDVELRYSPSGTPIANGTIAVQRDFKNQQGEYETDFFNFVVIGKLGEVMANHIRKGDKFGIKGKLQNRVWEKDDGKKQYFTEVFVDGFDFPVKPKGKNENTPPPKQNTGNAAFKDLDDDPFADNGEPIDINDDDLPF